LNRINPGAMAAETVLALNQLAQRFAELRIIMPHAAMRKELLIFEKWRMDVIVSRAKNETTLLSRHAVFKGKPIYEHEPDIIEKKINYVLYAIQNLWVSPYYEQAEQTKLFLNQAKKNIRSNEFLNAGKMINTALEILKQIMFENNKEQQEKNNE